MRATCKGTSGWSSDGVDPLEASLKKEPPRGCFLVVDRVLSISRIGTKSQKPGASCPEVIQRNLPFTRASIASSTGTSNTLRCLHTSITRRSFPWISTEEPLYAVAEASAMIYVLVNPDPRALRIRSQRLTGANASKNSPLPRAFDCWATSLGSS